MLYHDPALFHGDIILDQRWAIEAIYTLFHREKCYRQLSKRHGRFTLNDLNDLAWEDAGFTRDEQRLFLSFMQSCSLCFRISAWQHKEDPDEVEYLAPELLPARETLLKDIELRTRLYDDRRMGRGTKPINAAQVQSGASRASTHPTALSSTNSEDASSASIWFRYRHRFLHQGVMQRFLVRVGEQFRDTALYWKDGVLLESAQHQALAEVECLRKLDGNPARGEIELRVRGPGRELLLNTLRNELERLHDAGIEVEQHVSLDHAEWIDLAKLPDAVITGQIVSDQRRALDVQPFRFLLHRDANGRLTGPYEGDVHHEQSCPVLKPTTNTLNRPTGVDKPVFLSYAWGDSHETGPSREEIVDRLFDSLSDNGYHVQRDKKDIGYKGLISEFMTQVGRATCIVTVISDKYVRSINCMWELFLIHQHSNANGDFKDHICPIVLADARIHAADDRLQLVEYWCQKRDSLNKQGKKLFNELSPDGSLKDVDRVRKIASSIDPLMTFIADINTRTPALLEDDDFAEIKRAIDERLKAVHTAARD